ncbi:hypothetical protein [Scytonema sp. NUACC21]
MYANRYVIIYKATAVWAIAQRKPYHFITSNIPIILLSPRTKWNCDRLSASRTQLIALVQAILLQAELCPSPLN